MKRNNRLLSILLSLALVVGMIPVLGVVANAADYEPLPNFSISKEGIISFDHAKDGISSAYYGFAKLYGYNGYIDGVEQFWLRPTYLGPSIGCTWTDQSVVFDLQEWLEANDIYAKGTYSIEIIPEYTDEISNYPVESDIYKSTFKYKYTTSIPQLATPKNLRWNGTTATWNKVPNATGYTIQLLQLPDVSHPIKEYVSNTNSISFEDITFQSSEVYCFSVLARHGWNEGYKWSESAFSDTATGSQLIAGYVSPSDNPNDDNTSPGIPFVDVNKSDDYYEAVKWAYYSSPQITNGIDATHFGPKNTVKRCEAVTFLWRAGGCPEPSSYTNPFKDVKSSDYFYKSVLWAVEKGITNGTTDTTFAPNDTLTTAHMITFLYRWKTENPDQGWYEKAAGWAGTGYGGKPFGVNTVVNNTTNCPRGYVVMFLQKAKNL